MLIHEVTDIDAAPDEVWRVLTDFGRYESWNPFVVRCASSLVAGTAIDMWVRLGSGRPRRQREWIHAHTPGREFSYSIKPIPLHALRSYRSHSLTALEDGRTRYVSHFELTGWLAPITTIMYGAAMRRGFAAMSAGLRERAEVEADT